MKRRITIALSEVDKRKLFFLSTFAVLYSVCLFTDGLPLNDAPIKTFIVLLVYVALRSLSRGSIVYVIE